VLGQRLVHGATDRTDRRAHAHCARNCRCGDRAGGDKRADTRNGESRNTETGSKRTAAQNAAQDVAVVLVGDLTVTRTGRRGVAMVGDDRQVAVVQAEGAQLETARSASA
jgi:hypothetical protein